MLLRERDRESSAGQKREGVLLKRNRTTAWRFYASTQHAVGGQSVQCGLEERVAGVYGSVACFVV